MIRPNLKFIKGSSIIDEVKFSDDYLTTILIDCGFENGIINFEDFAKKVNGVYCDEKEFEKKYLIESGRIALKNAKEILMRYVQKNLGCDSIEISDLKLPKNVNQLR